MEYRKIVDVEFKEFDQQALEKSWEWLNDPQLKNLTMTPDFERESQQKWFEGLKTRKDYYLSAVWYDGMPVGVFGVKHITDSDGEVFGYIGEKGLWGKTVGVQMMSHLIDYAKLRNLKSIYSISLKENLSTYKLCKRFGFEVEKEVDDKKIMMRVYL